MKREQVVTLFGVVLLLIGCVGVGVTIYATQGSQERILSLVKEEEALKRQIAEEQSKNNAVLMQAADIVNRASDQGKSVAAWMNDRRNGSVDLSSSPEQLFDDPFGCVLYAEDYYPYGVRNDIAWSMTAHPIVETDEVPTLWELKNASGETLVVAYADYDVETGKYTNGFSGTIFDRIDWAAAIDGNTPA